MHYRNDAFTKNGADTLASIDEPTLQFGQRVKFSVGDIKGINTLYNCKAELRNPHYGGLFKDYITRKDMRQAKNLLNRKKNIYI